MTVNEYAILALPVLLGAAGTTLLVREVRFGHRFEVLSRELDEIQALQSIYPLNPREYWVRHLMYGLSYSRVTAESMVKQVDDASVQGYADDAYRDMEDRAASSLERWRSTGARNALLLRKRLLWAGFILLMAGFITTFVDATYRFTSS